MSDSETRILTLVPREEVPGGPRPALIETGLANVVTLQRRREARLSAEDEEGFFVETLSEYQWARDAAGLAPTTLDKLVKPVIEICDFYGVAPWRLTPREVDRYFAGAGKRGHSTTRTKINRIDGYFAFLEQRYAGEILRRFGAAVESPIDPFNRPRHRGDFGLRIPPSQQAMKEFFARWRADLPQARKPMVACRDYVMAKLAYLSGVRVTELCGVQIGDVHWEPGQWGRFIVNGKGARGSGPRQRQAYMFQEGRDLLWWYVEEVRGQFRDDPQHPSAPLFPSERLPTAVAALNLPIAPSLDPSTFRRVLKAASAAYLTGPVTHLHPHLLRHACATHNYERGMTLWEVQKVLGHDWATTTVRYMASVQAEPEHANLAASARAAERLVMDKGNLR
ncbi:tyrosine-type recombinase/integrase [Streptomyces sp. NPDC059506]|uniref:tyrosine-type recombinase/integrase n=1 Tax=Streptomyces sp. NPDC059506 TaxID=3347751 RepID=UPI000CB5FD5A|nr:integrase [Streptomyces sp. DJ]